jgi:hypothetical protein
MLSATLMLSLGLLAARADTPELHAGIRLVEEGDLAGAVAPLEAASRLPGARAPERARAHLYLAMAFLGLGDDEQARAHMRVVWLQDPTLILDAHEYAPPVIALHRETRPPAPPRARQLPALIGLGTAASTTGIVLASGGAGGAAGGGPPPAGSPRASAGPPELRLSNCDDECHAYVNGVQILSVGLGLDSGWIALSPYLREGPNEIAFELENVRAGIAYGFQVRAGEHTLFEQICGVANRTGCENDRRYPPGLARRFVFTLFQERERRGRAIGEH